MFALANGNLSRKARKHSEMSSLGDLIENDWCMRDRPGESRQTNSITAEDRDNFV
jgi:hypothetical protein